MSFLGGGFDFSSGLQQIGDRFSQLREELEQSIEETIRAERFSVLPGTEEQPAPAEGDGNPNEEDWAGSSTVSPWAGEAPAAGDLQPAAQQHDGIQVPSVAPVSDGDAPAANGVNKLLDDLHQDEARRSHEAAVSAAVASPEGAQGDEPSNEMDEGEESPTQAIQQRAPEDKPSALLGHEAGQLDSVAVAPAPAERAVAAQDAQQAAALPETLDHHVPLQAAPIEASAAAHAASSVQLDNLPADTQGWQGPDQQQQQRDVHQAASQPAAAGQSQLSAPLQSDERIEDMDAAALRSLVGQLREALAVREHQIERKSQEAAQLAEAAEALRTRNAELAQATKEGEAVAELQREFEGKLAAAERKVYALTKERDALRRGSEKLSGMDDLVREKDAIIKQVMEEGEALSRKQLAQEQTIKRLRGQAKELQGKVGELAAALDAERSKAASAVSERASTAGELYSLREQHAAELAAERQHYERLLEEAREAQAAAEAKAAEAAEGG